jgi:hypothetical protein
MTKIVSYSVCYNDAHGRFEAVGVPQVEMCGLTIGFIGVSCVLVSTSTSQGGDSASSARILSPVRSQTDLTFRRTAAEEFSDILLVRVVCCRADTPFLTCLHNWRAEN